MSGEPDVRLEGVTHEEILDWVRQGKAGSSTHALEARLRKIVEALSTAAREVNGVVQRAAGDWDGAAADSATAAMAVLRDFDDELHTHGSSDRDSAMGQSGESAATRNRVPPIPLGLDGQHSILGTTVDPKVRIDARRAAEEQARLVLAEYQEATRHRLASLPRIAPVPAVVLDTSTDPGTSPSKTQAKPAEPVPAHRIARKPVETPSGAVESPGQAPVKAVRRTRHPAPGTVPQAVVPQATSIAGAARGDPNGPAPTASTVLVGGIVPAPTGGIAPEPVGEPELGVDNGGRPKNGERAQPGAERLIERERLVQHEANARRTNAAGTGLVGEPSRTSGQEDDEHRSRYHLPTEEHFETDEEYLRDGEFFVAPDVIGGPE